MPEYVSLTAGNAARPAHSHNRFSIGLDGWANVIPLRFGKTLAVATDKTNLFALSQMQPAVSQHYFEYKSLSLNLRELDHIHKVGLKLVMHFFPPHMHHF
ncbi:MAG: hypothetical protein ACI85U_002985 [Candidatus Promineifilaceae bacterium]|jgi:hypothetical protein